MWLREGKSAGWKCDDITQAVLPVDFYDFWHDRAVFHFLTRAEDRRKYIETLSRSLKTGGLALISTFALDGPERCSGLEIVRYNAESLSAELDEGFDLVGSTTESHQTPFGTRQSFIYCTFRAANQR